jgi:hypothetical protein
VLQFPAPIFLQLFCVQISKVNNINVIQAPIKNSNSITVSKDTGVVVEFQTSFYSKKLWGCNRKKKIIIFHKGCGAKTNPRATW